MEPQALEESQGAPLLPGCGPGMPPCYPTWEKGRHQCLYQLEETYLKISLSEVKLTFEQQTHPFQGREKQRNPVFTDLLCVDIYAKLQL